MDLYPQGYINQRDLQNVFIGSNFSNALSLTQTCYDPTQIATTSLFNQLKTRCL